MRQNSGHDRLRRGRGDKRRDRAIERIGDGAEQLGLGNLNDAVSGDCFGAGVEDILFDLRHSQRETPERGIQSRQIAIDLGQKRDFSFCDAAERLRAAGKSRFSLSGIFLTRISHRGQKHTAVRDHGPQIVKLRDRFRCGKKIRLEMTEDNFLQHVFEEINLMVAFDQSVDSGSELMKLGG